MRSVIFTSDNHDWLLRGFFHQWQKYAHQKHTYLDDPLELEVAGFSRPKDLPQYVPFYSIGAFADYPVNRWSDAVIKYLSSIQDDHVLILLEDYWLMRPLNRDVIYQAYGYMVDHPEVVRFDLTTDRLYSRGVRYVESIGMMNVCEAKDDYSLSFQAGIFNRKLLLSLLRPGESPWQAEINGTGRLNKLPYRVVGSYQWPMCYMIVCNKGQIDRQGQWMFPARTLPRQDWIELETAGYLKKPEVVTQ